jgi:hypothetical protein
VITGKANTLSDRMTHVEAVMLCRFAKACCPQQAFDDLTPDAWFELLRDLPADDCKRAIIEVTKRQPFVSPSEIRTTTRRYRYDRISAFGPFDPPPELADADFDSWRAWFLDVQTRVADGDITREEWDREQAARGLTGNRKVPELGNVFRRIPSEQEPA